MTVEEQILAVCSVLDARGIDTQRMRRQMRQDGVKDDAELRNLTGALYDGLSYGNWAPRGGSHD